MGWAAQDRRNVERTEAGGSRADRCRCRSTVPPAEEHAVSSPEAEAVRHVTSSPVGIGQVLAMQRLAGNAAVSRFVSGLGIRGTPRPALAPRGLDPATVANGNPPGELGAVPDMNGSVEGPAAVAGGSSPEGLGLSGLGTANEPLETGLDPTSQLGGTRSGGFAAIPERSGGTRLGSAQRREAGMRSTSGTIGPLAGARSGDSSGGGSGRRRAKPELGPPTGIDADQAVDGPGADHDLISTELAEHERWAGSFGDLGTSGSDQRARYLLDVAGQGAVSGAAGGAMMGFAMSAVGAGIGQMAGRRLATMAVSRGLSATPIPGLGSAIGGVMAVAGLAMRDWGATGQTIGRLGTGTGYERLANDLEGLAEILDVAMSIMDVVAGVLGGIAVGMWVAAVLSAGTLSPLAASLSAIAIGMNLATTAVGLIINAIVRPVVTALRALHTFDSQGDPAQIEQEGQMLSAAAGQVTGAVAGARASKTGGRVGRAGGSRVDAGITRIQERRTGGAPTRSASSEGGPRLHVEMPEAPGVGTRLDADTIPMARPDAEGVGPAPASLPHPSSPAHPPEHFGDLDSLVRELNEDPNVVAILTDTRPELTPRETDWTRKSARAYANRQASRYPREARKRAQEARARAASETNPQAARRATEEAEAWDRRVAAMEDPNTQAGHTAPARGAEEARIGEEDWDDQYMMPLHSRRDPQLAVTVTDPSGRQRTNTRHRAQEQMIDAARDRVRAAGGDEMTPQGFLDASEEVRWRAENTPLAQDEVIRLRSGGLAGSESGPPVDPTTGRVIIGDSGPSPSSPGAATHSGSALRPGWPDHTPKLAPTPNRADAMAQYQAQVRADPGRESGVWRDADGDYHVMQGGPDSVAPPTAGRPPLELIYHSHPTTTDARTQGLNTQPSQGGGDFSVLQYQHGQGPTGRRQVSELHFPVYDSAGNHVGYGATQFTYEPTHPLPLRVQTTTPTGRTTTQRYWSFADFQARSGVSAGGATPAQAYANFTGAQTRLRADQAATRARVDQATADLAPGPGMVGIREGRELGRQMGDTDARPSPPGPAYTAQVVGLRPGESMEIPINPVYPSPPGTTAELAVLRERIALSRQAQQDLGRTERQMQGQAVTQRGQDAQLGQAGELSRSLAAGGQAHSTATSEIAATNREQQSTAGGAIDNLASTGQEATAVATLVGSLRVFQGLSHLFGYLPGSLGSSARGASRDCTRLISALNRVSDANAAQGEMRGQQSGLQGNEQRIGTVAQQNQATSAELTQGQQQVGELRGANLARLTETEATRDLARQERQAAARDRDGAQAAHDDLLDRMRAWAVDHRAAREEAVVVARARLAGQGYEVQEAR